MVKACDYHGEHSVEGQIAHAEFVRLMSQGDAAMLNQRFDDAVRAYSEASRLFPGDDGATKALRKAQKTADDVRTLQSP